MLSYLFILKIIYKCAFDAFFCKMNKPSKNGIVEKFSRAGTGAGNMARNLLILSLGVGGAGKSFL